MLADFWWGYLKEKDYLEPLGIKLKWILKKQDGIILWFYNILIVKTVADILNTVYHGRLRSPESICLYLQMEWAEGYPTVIALWRDLKKETKPFSETPGVCSFRQGTVSKI